MPADRSVLLITAPVPSVLLVVEALINKVDAPIPNCMFEQRIDEIVASFDRQLQQQGMSLKLYCQYTGMDEQAIRDTYRERAEGEVKLRLALEKVAELENFEVTEDEINNGLGEIAAANNMVFKRWEFSVCCHC